MFTWHRVFGSLEQGPTPADLCEELARHGLQVRPTFRGDDDGWFGARLDLDDGASVVHIERYLMRAEKLRPELNNWSAWVESLPTTREQGIVLDALVSTNQLFTILEETDQCDAPTSACLILCRWIAQTVQGVYQIDGLGVYDAHGVLLLEETIDRAHV